MLIKLRYFAGLTIGEAAELLGISEATAKRWWAHARAWLFYEIRSPPEASTHPRHLDVTTRADHHRVKQHPHWS